MGAAGGAAALVVIVGVGNLTPIWRRVSVGGTQRQTSVDRSCIVESVCLPF
jgi:hypothetical protein